jgi:hypothetical protein
MRSIARTFFLASAFAAAAASPAAAQEWRDSLTAQLRREITHTRVSSDLMRLGETGVVMVLQKDGVAGKPGTDGFILESRYRDGEVRQPSGLSALLGGTTNMRQFKAGEKVYVNRVDVGRDGSSIRLSLMATDLANITVDGNSRTARYAGGLLVDFPQGSLATASVADVMAHLSGILKTEAAASAPATISLGQTPEQVEQAMGKPQTVINLGARVIFVYPAMRVIFQDGKVADVQ